MTIDQILADVIRREGGYVHDPADRGGPTKYGITQRTLRGQAVTAADVRRVTKADARAIYRRRYVDEPGFATLPDPLLAQVVDDGVLSGPRQAVKDLQRAIGGVTVDGRLGPVTRAALDAAGARLVHARLLHVRSVRLGRIVQRAPTQARFLAGWLTRTTAFAETWPERGSMSGPELAQMVIGVVLAGVVTAVTWLVRGVIGHGKQLAALETALATLPTRTGCTSWRWRRRSSRVSCGR